VAKGRASGARASNRVTGAQVAREANVDPAIVSKLLQENPSVRVSRETRKRVMDVVDRLGYRPNYAAQRSVLAKKHGLGLKRRPDRRSRGKR